VGLGAQYERTVQPLVSEAEFQTTQAAIQSFAATTGPQLQRDLVASDTANKHTSYISGAPTRPSACSPRLFFICRAHR
jgi:hypothetical protein